MSLKQRCFGKFMNSIQIEVMDSKVANSISTILLEVLHLQRSLIATRDSASRENGFLISAFSFEELQGLLGSDGKLFVARIDGELVGYLLITSISEFSSLIGDGSDHASGGRLLGAPEFCFSEYKYLYQVAVSERTKGLGIGKRLLTEAKRNSSASLLTDVLIEPVPNDASLAFFWKNGFQNAGVLELGAYRTFGNLKSQVLVWKIPDKGNVG